jgi:hypothetical protein
MGTVVPAENVYRYVSSDGTTAGNKSMIGDYSSGVTEFWIENTERTIQIRRAVIEIRDSGQFSYEKYGALNALTNGILVKVKDNNGVEQLDLTDGLPIKSYAHWGRLCYDRSNLPIGSGDGFVNVRWTFEKGGSDILLKPGWKLVVQLRDNLTGLIDHTFFTHGTYTEGG